MALQAAVRFPERVSGLVLACCTPAFGATGGPQQQAFLAKTPRLGPLDDGASMRELAIELIPTMVGPGGGCGIGARRRRRDGAHSGAQLPPRPARLVHFDQRAALPALAMPTLVVAGRPTRCRRQPWCATMAERLPAATYREIDAGHLAPSKSPMPSPPRWANFSAGLDRRMPVT